LQFDTRNNDLYIDFYMLFIKISYTNIKTYRGVIFKSKISLLLQIQFKMEKFSNLINIVSLGKCLMDFWRKN